MSVTFLVPSATNRQGIQIPHGKTFTQMHRGLHCLTWKAVLTRLWMHWCVFYRFEACSNNQTQTPDGPLHHDRTSGVNLPRKGKILRFLHLSSMTVHTWFVLFFHLWKGDKSFLLSSCAAQMSAWRPLLPSQPSNALLPDKWNVLCKYALKFIQYWSQIPVNKRTVTFICGKAPNVRGSLKSHFCIWRQKKKKKKSSFCCYRLITSVYP